MEKKFNKIKNVSRGSLILDLTAVTQEKIVVMKPDSFLTITADEYEYLTTSHRALFKHDIETISVADDVKKVKTERIYTDKDIDAIVEMSEKNFNAEIKKIDCVEVLKDIRIKSEAEGKTKKFLNTIDKRIIELNGSVTLM